MKMVQLFFKITMFLFLISHIIFPINQLQISSFYVLFKFSRPLDSSLDFDIGLLFFYLFFKSSQLSLQYLVLWFVLIHLLQFTLITIFLFRFIVYRKGIIRLTSIVQSCSTSRLQLHSQLVVDLLQLGHLEIFCSGVQR